MVCNLLFIDVRATTAQRHTNNEKDLLIKRTYYICRMTLVFSLGSSSVLICRVYNGVHSPADVVAGGLLGCLIVTFMNRFDNLMDLSNSMNGQGRLISTFLKKAS